MPIRPIRPMRALRATTIGLTLTLLVAACGNGSDTGPELSTTEHNAADVAFATDMLQHHAQALSMVDLTLERTLDPEVQALAEEIRDAQAPEIETFTDWLIDWDEEIPATMRDHVNAPGAGDDMSDSMAGMDSDMPGMMSSADMSSLKNASDATFQTMWLEMMVEHHQGAVQMARTEQETGRFRAAVELAQTIASSQSEEIDTMQDLID